MDHSMHNMPKSGGMNHGECSMKMTINADVENICVLFDFWRINGALSMVLSCLIIFILGIGYEYLRSLSQNWQERIERSYRVLANSEPESIHLEDSYDPLTSPRLLQDESLEDTINIKSRFPLSIIYAIQVFYSFMLMLIFMTYNIYLMLAVTFGALFGHFFISAFKPLSASRSFACH
ncbi:Ctr copper transporter [Neoconidiobolus thromboides FSU 785]|nr:Ctr copper transporter [Neoconidiobolus thromboides FSU 785]